MLSVSSIQNFGDAISELKRRVSTLKFIFLILMLEDENILKL